MERTHEELYKKDFNEPDYYDGVVSHPIPDILESKVKWVLGSTAVNKPNGRDRIPVELLKTPQDDAVKVLHSVCQQIRKTQQWPQDWKRSSSQFPVRVVPKNVLTTGRWHSSPTQVRWCLKSCMLGFSIMWNKNFQTSKLGLEKEVELRSNCQQSLGHRER